MRCAILAGRILFAAVFVISGFNHYSRGLIAHAASAGVPAANVLVPIAGMMAIVGGLSIAAGFYTRLGALILIAYLVPVTVKMHAFWTIADATQRQNEITHFLLNASLLGACLAFVYFGAGALGIDQRYAPGRTWWRRRVELPA